MQLSDKYQAEGGNLPEVYNTLYLLERIYPFRLQAVTDIQVHCFDQITVNCSRISPCMCVPETHEGWTENYSKNANNYTTKKVAQSFGLDRYEVSLQFHICLSIAHEWGHLRQLSEEEDVAHHRILESLTSDDFESLDSSNNHNQSLEVLERFECEKEAETWAWKYMSKYGKNILAREFIPKELLTPLIKERQQKNYKQLSFVLE